jgi:hypothetical protein
MVILCLGLFLVSLASLLLTVGKALVSVCGKNSAAM